ncbi:ESX secretion-associated protein EspG [Amycolatopsis sp. 195334CR]|uniref:ESX secretion-associated protein EspG n=1 Tax=Amycolatopsis sp. 195334CR TaxID=2814588 RepID=UPI001A8FF9D4|nr:ESX secretion-associated protein EspG [Amycolatopsis sp. 195334CR]MBN6036180.1 ESX secretion-associated protein EspG [Amycolatopsis sp. 195334CR]
MVIAHRAEISLNTLLSAMRWTGYDQPHLVFAGGERYVPPTATAGLDKAAEEELRECGFVTGKGKRLTGEFEDTLHLLNRPPIEYFAHVRTRDESYEILVAGHDRTAVVVVHQDERVWLKPYRGKNAAALLVDHLPDFPAAKFTPFTVPRHEMVEQIGVSGIYDEKRSRSAEAKELEEIFSVPEYGSGLLHAARWDHRGNRRQAPVGLSYLDIDAGRVGLTSGGPLGNEHIVVLPGDRTRLSEKVASLGASLH